MAGVGRTPKAPDQRIGHEAPTRGDWKVLTAVGWQHGDPPPCPVRGVAAAETWGSWMAAWFAAHWDPSDLPNLRLLIGLWAKVQSGKASREQHTMYLRLADDLGITREGQQDRRWQPPLIVEGDPRPHLRVMGSRRDA